MDPLSRHSALHVRSRDIGGPTEYAQITSMLCRVRVGPQQLSCYRPSDASIPSRLHRYEAEAGARDGLASAAD